MARHRNVRTMNYEDEYDGYDDVYGHSVEDDYAASPSVQHFLFDRSQGQQMSSFIQEENDILEEDESIEHDPSPAANVPLRIPPLGDLELAQLYSCLDIIRDRMGDSVPEQKAIDTILAVNFCSEKALDQLLKASTPPITTKSNVKEAPTPLPSYQVSANQARQTPIKVIPARRISTGFSLPPVISSQPADQGLAVEETTKQMGRLRTPGRSLSPPEKESTPSATPKS